MKEFLKKRVLLVVIIILVIIFAVFRTSKEIIEHKEIVRMKNIRERGTLNALINYNSTDYFLYKGEPMGFQLELLENLAKELGLKLFLVPSNDIETSLEQINNDNIDLIASNIHITDSREEKLCFSDVIFQTRQVLIQRNSSDLVKSFADLDKDTIFVPKGSIYETHLQHMRELSESDFAIIALEDVNEEEFVRWVSLGDIDYTVVSENMATASLRYFKNIDISFTMSFEQDIAWGISCHTDSLELYVNAWIEKNKNTPFFRNLYNKYYVNPRASYQSEDNYSMEKGKISSFDNLIKKYAGQLGWDWRLLASLIYQESRFRNYEVSSSGAIGIMQLMPDVAEKYGITIDSPLESQIAAGVKHLKALEKQLPPEISDPEQRTLFLIASYNIGVGHLLDARRLAEQNHKDPNVWFNSVDEELLKKENPRISRDSIVRHGYAKSSQTYNFVSEIMQRYHHYQNLVN